MKGVLIKFIIMKVTKFDEAIWWLWTIMIFSAYLLISFDLITSSSIVYQIINIIWSLFLVYISIKKHAYQLEVLNILWALIGIIAIFNIFI